MSKAIVRVVRRRERSGLESLDGAHVGKDGHVFEVFAPRWWELGRWLAWAMSKRAKGTVRFETVMLTGVVVVRVVKVWEVRARSSRRIEDQFKKHR